MATIIEKILVKAQQELEDKKEKIEDALDCLEKGKIIYSVDIPSLWEDEGGISLENCIGSSDLEKSIAKARREFKKMNQESIPSPVVYLYFPKGEKVLIDEDQLDELRKYFKSQKEIKI